MDPRVIDIPWPARALLVHGVILRTRPKRSAEAYQKVWTERGSPLRFHGDDLVAGLQDELGPDVRVALAMRYQNPSVRKALADLAEQGADDVVVVPLFPQYSQSAWASAYDEVVRVAGAMQNVPNLRFVPPFYDHPSFLDAVAEVARPHLDAFAPDRVLMSFHGLPEKHLKKSDVSGNHCLRSPDCCRTICHANRFCYGAQSYATARGIAARLGLEPHQYEVAFQSRLTKRWVQPFTDVRLEQLPKEGVRRLAVLCPSFVADCLETIEEIGMQAKETFVAAGGEDLLAVPCVNAERVWVTGLAGMVREAGVRR
ncbi:MAG: ferrochelatase, partial [Planctomycetes bacterium]|nr:ferrochelatase [Planctomycetota bacterium]